MLSKIRRRMTFTNVAMTLVLVFAMSGGAYAAKHYVITSTKQISPKVLKALQGKSGANGANGVNGANGKDGAPGAPGEKGAAGKDGVSVTSSKLASKNANCPEGGSEFTSAESKKTYACNGAEGKQGSPWTAGGKLPAGATETGTWTLHAPAKGPGEYRATNISFPIPLAAELNNTATIFVKSGESTPEQCAGNLAEPGAKSGRLCVFEAGESGFLAAIHSGGLTFEAVLDTKGEVAVGTTGVELLFATTESKEEVSAEGTWAVTG
jgi:Collagen triple helix repeat (20 copies)